MFVANGVLSAISDNVFVATIYISQLKDAFASGAFDAAQYARLAQLLLLVPGDEEHENYGYAQENLARLAGAADARGRRLEVIQFDVTATAQADGGPLDVPYLNCYLANGGVVVPVAGSPSDEIALARLSEVFADREVVGVPGAALSYGGGGPHCITQQMPLGRPVPG